MIMKHLTLSVLFSIFAIRAAIAADTGVITEGIRILNQPYKVTLQVDRVSAFVMPGAIQSTRLPTAYIKNFNIEADPGSNILYVSPKKETRMACTLFIVVDGVPYEFSIT